VVRPLHWAAHLDPARLAVSTLRTPDMRSLVKAKSSTRLSSIVVLILTLSRPATPPVQAGQPPLDRSASRLSSEEPDEAATSPSGGVMFIENVGQFGDGARFQVRGGSGTIWLAEDAVWLTVLEKPPSTGPLSPAFGEEDVSLPFHAGREDGDEGTPRKGVNLKLSFVRANLHPILEPFDRLDTHVSYFMGDDPAGWRADVPVWGGVRYRDLYPAIDLEITGENGHVVQRLVASEGAELGAVQLRVEGAEEMTLDGDLLLLTTAVGEYTLPLLQVSGADRAELTAPTVGGDEVGSPFGETQPETEAATPQSGTLDLLYATFLGGSNDEHGYGIGIDASGAAYATGVTYSSDFPDTAGAFDTTFKGYCDAFVAKLNAAGSALAYATFLGGSGVDVGSGIAVDASGAAFVVGSTASSDFPATAGAYDTSWNGGWDVFAVKLNATGSDLAYGTLLGEGQADAGYGIAVDQSGAAYLTGRTDSPGFPTTVGAFQMSLNASGYPDAFIVKLNAAGSTLSYSTFLGGWYDDLGYGIVVDASGAAYVTGYTNSFDFPTTGWAFDPSFNGGYFGQSKDAFAVKLNAAGSELAYGTFLGGTEGDEGYAIATSATGSAYVTGLTYSSDFPTTAGAFDTSFNGGWHDAFVVRLNTAGSTLEYATLLGGSDLDEGCGIAIDASGAAYVTGYTFSSDFPTLAWAFDTSFNGGTVDAFVVKLNAAGSTLAYASFLGGSNSDGGYGIAIDSSGAAYATGQTSSSDFPTNAGAFDTSLNGGNDAFVVKLAVGPPSATGPVLVEDENGDPIDGAQVFTNGALAGTTDADGTLIIPDLAIGDRLVARFRVTEVPSRKDHHSQDSSQNWAYRVYITSLDVPQSGDPTPWTVPDPSMTQTLTIKKSNTLIGFNVVGSVEWDANSSYLDELQQGFQSASNYLYDATDGQMLLERVTIYDDNQNMGDADYQIRASNQEWPRANVGGILSTENLHVFLGRYFDGQSANQGTWTGSNGYRTQIHEFGHYGLGLYDSYFYYDSSGVRHDSHCTSAEIRTNHTPEINATLMDYQYNASEFSMQDVSGLWSAQCEDTDQWKKNGQSDWGTILGHYEDTSSPARWEMKTPADYGGVVVGPGLQPVNGWSTVDVGNDASTGVCEPPPSYRVEHLWGAPAKGASVMLRKGDMAIAQGKTDDNGEITVLGASSGDRVVVELWGIDLRINSILVDCGTLGHSQDAIIQPTVIVLQPAPFTLGISTAPGAAANQVNVIVKTSTELSGAPAAYLTQNGADSAVLVPLSYDAGLQAYTGMAALDTNMAASGTIIAKAADTSSEVVEVASQFTLEHVVTGQDITVWSSDGQAVLYLPAGSISADGRVNIAAAQLTSTLPESLILISGPYTIQGDEGLDLVNTASLTMFYLNLGGSLSHVNVGSAQIHRWDGQTWQSLPSTSSEDVQMVSAAIRTLGTYVLLAEKQEKLFLPLVIRSSP
jgi:hypothetical protein